MLQGFRTRHVLRYFIAALVVVMLVIIWLFVRYFSLLRWPREGSDRTEGSENIWSDVSPTPLDTSYYEGWTEYRDGEGRYHIFVPPTWEKRMDDASAAGSMGFRQGENEARRIAIIFHPNKEQKKLDEFIESWKQESQVTSKEQYEIVMGSLAFWHMVVEGRDENTSLLWWVMDTSGAIYEFNASFASGDDAMSGEYREEVMKIYSTFSFL